jgi:hypothetical protein
LANNANSGRETTATAGSPQWREHPAEHVHSDHEQGVRRRAPQKGGNLSVPELVAEATNQTANRVVVQAEGIGKIGQSSSFDEIAT